MATTPRAARDRLPEDLLRYSAFPSRRTCKSARCNDRDPLPSGPENHRTPHASGTVVDNRSDGCRRDRRDCPRERAAFLASNSFAVRANTGRVSNGNAVVPGTEVETTTRDGVWGPVGGTEVVRSPR